MTWLSLSLTSKLCVAACLGWTTASSLYYFPHSLSYFNEMAGGPENGAAHLVDSNLDWGQDLFFLKKWYDEHPEARPLYLAYFGQFDPRVIGIEYELPRPGQWLKRPGFYAASINLVKGLEYAIPDGAGKVVFVKAGQLPADCFIDKVGGYSIRGVHHVE